MATRKQAPLNEFLWRNAPSVNLGGGEGSNTTAPYFETGGQIYDYRNPSQGMTQDQAGASILGGATPENYLKGRYGDQYGSGVKYDPATGMVDYMQDTSFSLLKEFQPLLTLGGMALGANGFSNFMDGGGFGNLFGGGGGNDYGLGSFGGGMPEGGVDSIVNAGGDAFGYTPEYQFLGNGGANNYFSGLDFTGMAPTQNVGTSLFGGALGNAGAGGLLDGLGGWLKANPELAKLLGTGGSTLLGMFGSDKKADALKGLQAQLGADRAPYNAQAQAWMANPGAYFAGPGKAAVDANLRALSSTYGNPIDSPTALGIATDAGLKNWQNAVLGFGNTGLGGQGIQAQLGQQAIGAEGGIYDALGYGLENVFNPKKDNLEQILKAIASGGGGKLSYTAAG